MKNFLKLGGKEVKSLEKANMLVVGGTTVQKTAILIIAVARGMDVISDRRIVESRRKEVLLDKLPCLPDEDHEAEWGTTPKDERCYRTWEEGIVQVLLYETTVFTTKDLEDYKFDLTAIVKALGGNIVRGHLPSSKYGRQRS
jgi:hypothetical protein